MEVVKTSIIPHHPIITPKETAGVLNLEAICVFAAIGFFLEKDAWYTDQTALQPASDYVLDENGKILSEKTWWQWHYSPRDISLKQATEEFAHLFEHIVEEQTRDKQIILPLSGGLDSRTLAAALDKRSSVKAYSYEFEHGIPETDYGKAIAKVLDYDFQALVINKPYLWKVIEELAVINGCYADFTHPRPMAFRDLFANMGDIFLLGHWGDVLFDDMGVPNEIKLKQQVQMLLKKLVKKGGMELGTALWNNWGLKGEFETYLKARIENHLTNLNLDNANSNIRAFKSLYWAPRWTSANMGVFSNIKQIALPYYHDEMCKFICTVPEQHLAGRKIQIEYIKMKSPELAKIHWQSHTPFNLYNYHWNKSPWNLAFRFERKIRRQLNKYNGKPLIQRNWELQFLGTTNDIHLRSYLLDNETLNSLIPKDITEYFYQKFKLDNPVSYAHTVSMLLTISLFCKHNYTSSH